MIVSAVLPNSALSRSLGFAPSLLEKVTPGELATPRTSSVPVSHGNLLICCRLPGTTLFIAVTGDEVDSHWKDTALWAGIPIGGQLTPGARAGDETPFTLATVYMTAAGDGARLRIPAISAEEVPVKSVSGDRLFAWLLFCAPGTAAEVFAAVWTGEETGILGTAKGTAVSAGEVALRLFCASTGEAAACR